MKLTQTQHFCIGKALLSNYFLQPHYATSSHPSPQVLWFPSRSAYFLKYARHNHLRWWWEKCISKRSLIKEICSWRVNLFILWTLKRGVIILFYVIFGCCCFGLNKIKSVCKNFFSNADDFWKWCGQFDKIRFALDKLPGYLWYVDSFIILLRLHKATKQGSQVTALKSPVIAVFRKSFMWVVPVPATDDWFFLLKVQFCRKGLEDFWKIFWSLRNNNLSSLVTSIKSVNGWVSMNKKLVCGDWNIYLSYHTCIFIIILSL